MSHRFSRRDFLRTSAAGLAAGTWAFEHAEALAQLPGERPKQSAEVKVLNPRGRVPMSLIIDDSTCLVNLAHFCIPHFAEVFPNRYQQDWRKLPREIPDAFVRKFGEWCRGHGIRGKYSVIPYPACVGWIDRRMPGWTRKELEQSVALVREFMTPNWDIHPEMVTHTWIINPKTGRPYEERTIKYMENWDWSVGRSADELAEYMAYALRILKNAGLPCEGITTPGGFGNKALPELAQGTLQAVRDVFGAEIPHYFRHLYIDDKSVAPQVQYAAGLDGPNRRCVVSIIGCTSDWFGGWDGLELGSADKFITRDLKSGRLVDVIARGEPAIIVCHWPGVYFNGFELGFNIFKEVVTRLNARYDNLIWLKNSEIARYWAAKELTKIERKGFEVTLNAPFACPGFTVEMEWRRGAGVLLKEGDKTTQLPEVTKPLELKPGTRLREKDRLAFVSTFPRGAVDWSSACSDLRSLFWRGITIIR